MDKTSEQCRDVYAYFGVAMYAAQCLEQGMIYCLLLIDHYPSAISKYKTTEARNSAFDEFFEQKSKRTMGALLGRMQSLGVPSSDIENKLKLALDKRNELAHGYFSENAAAFMSEDGRSSMIKELDEAREFFMEVDAQLSKITREIGKQYGLTEELIEKEIERLMKEAESDI